MATLDLLGMIGGTPLIELRHMSPNPGVRVFAKLEGQNPSGSIKDRIVLAMVEEAERRGDLKPGDTIVEASSGNTAIALAMVAKQKGYTARTVIPRDVAPSIGDILPVFGVEITWCESRGGMKGAIEAARTIAEDSGGYYLRQFSDLVNVETHYRTTGSEIAEELPEVDVFVAGIGTGGTIMGVARRLRETSPNVKIIGVEPRMGERLQGLRSMSEGFMPPLMDLSMLDGRFLVDSASAIESARRVIETEGILAGVSSGAALDVALRMAQRIERGNVVVMFSDSAWKYLPARPWGAAGVRAEALDETYWW